MLVSMAGVFGTGGETCRNIKHVCNQRVATFADDRLASPRQPPAGDVMLRCVTLRSSS